MSPFRTFLDWLERGTSNTDFDAWIERQPKPPVLFAAITDVTSPPLNASIIPGVFYRVMLRDKPRWALFLCPCGCRAVITLSLQQAHRPRWHVNPSTEYRPVLRPSVWRDVGCFSHFWVNDGRIYWCHDTGVSPNETRSYNDVYRGA